MRYTFGPTKASFLKKYFGEKVKIHNETDLTVIDDELISLLDTLHFFNIHLNHIKKILNEEIDFAVYKIYGKKKWRTLSRMIGKNGNVLMKLLRLTGVKTYINKYRILLIGGDINLAISYLGKINSGRSHGTADKLL